VGGGYGSVLPVGNYNCLQPQLGGLGIGGLGIGSGFGTGFGGAGFGGMQKPGLPSHGGHGGYLPSHPMR
jgi:hypothetical protein